MVTFPEEFVEQVRTANDIVDVIGQRVQLQRKGKDFWGICPFHSEKTASFSVSPSKQIYYCFGCHAHGTVINFMMETERLSFPDAVRALAARAGIPVPESTPVSEEARNLQRERQRLLKVSQWVADLFHEQLLRAAEAKPARDYLERRGISPELIQNARLGFAFADWTGLARAAERNNVPVDALANLGLIIPRQQQGYYDRFRGRVMIPIADERGRVVAFGGRVLDGGQPKYLNSPEGPLFHKGRLLFGLDRAQTVMGKAGLAILMEGYMDVLAAWQHGFENAVASLGTALTPQQAKLIKRHTNQVILCYDADNAGQQATIRGMDVLQEAGLEVRVASMPEGKDPDDCLRQYGAEFFRREVLEQAIPLTDYKLKVLSREYRLEEVSGKAQYVAAATAVIARLNNAVAEAGYVQQLAQRLHVPESAIAIELARHKGRKRGGLRDKIGNDRNTSIRDSDGLAATMIEDPFVKGCCLAEGKLLSLIMRNLVGAEELLMQWQAIGAYAHNADKVIVEQLLGQLQSGQALDAQSLLEQAEDDQLGQRLAELLLTECPEEQNASIVARDCLTRIEQYSVRQAIELCHKRLASETEPQTRKQVLEELQSLLEKQKGLRT